MEYMITTEQLTKKYKNFTSVSNLSLHIRKGSIYGFLGPNGAGKSTTMKMLLGLTAPTNGSFCIDGKRFPNDRIAILKEIGSFIESPSFYANLTGRENLDIIRRILGLPRSSVEDALELVGLTEFSDRLAKKYSLGMKQRLGLAGALLGRPPILILDEPTNGLDPSGIHEIRNLVKSLPDLYDCTVLISSHMLSEIELKLARRCAEAGNTAQLEENLDRIDTYTDRIEHYVETMSTVQRLEQLEPKPKDVNTAALSGELQKALSFAADEGEKQLIFHGLTAPPAAILLDKELLFQIAENLTANALRFARETVMVMLCVTGGQLTLTVADDGGGFPPDLLNGGVQPFHKGMEEVGHFGMGLYICDLLCRKHDGSLTLRNDNGAVACVSLKIS